MSRHHIEHALALPRDAVLDAVVKLGTWLGATFGAAPPVQMPPGFSRSACGRDLRRAVANIVGHPLDATTERRFRSSQRRYCTPDQGELMAALCLIGQTGRLDEVDDLARAPDGRLDPLLAAALVDAYDRLEQARREAVTVMRHLLDPTVRHTAGEVAAAARAVRWLHEAEMDRLLRATEADPGSVTAALRRIRTIVAASPQEFLPSSVAHLRYGQVTRIPAVEQLTTEALSA